MLDELQTKSSGRKKWASEIKIASCAVQIHLGLLAWPELCREMEPIGFVLVEPDIWIPSGHWIFFLQETWVFLWRLKIDCMRPTRAMEGIPLSSKFDFSVSLIF